MTEKLLSERMWSLARDPVVCCAVGAQARLMSQALRKIAGNASKCNCTVIFLNQLRHKVFFQLFISLQTGG